MNDEELREIISEELNLGGDAASVVSAIRDAEKEKQLETSDQWRRMYNAHVEGDREFLQQVADAFGIRTDEVTVAFLERKAQALGGTQ